MAPRRGGSTYGSSTCPGAFASTESQVYFACVVIFFAVYIGISISLCVVRKKHGTGRRLLGAPYMLALLFMLVGYAIELSATVLLECNTVVRSSYYALAIAMTVFYYLAYWILLFIVVYTLNTMLREHLGSSSSTLKIVLLAIVGVMFAVTAAHIGITSYNLWTATDAGYSSNANFIIHPAERLRTAWNVLYFLSVIAAGFFALMTLFAMRSRSQSGSGLLIWVIALIFSMAFWIIIGIVFAASYLTDDFNIITFETNASLTYVQSFFQALSFIILLCIARHGAWSKSAVPASTVTPYAPVAQNQHTYAYNAGGQQDYYNQAPVYAGAK
ncbi:hypothetical protein T440DRAFT_476597 [Plenodomus tracheiphilus IPT5]|uniref:Uncharacterized protein n=1 Tax=Plenodomus tracheiphilus IPT5 TaxID=1408161 RepID=A0A6A7BHP3_9PLEO|nr:hypothetical protein T440DRAFT_476597 [Plenodomus tracheiphilus IPT5]